MAITTYLPAFPLDRPAEGVVPNRWDSLKIFSYYFDPEPVINRYGRVLLFEIMTSQTEADVLEMFKGLIWSIDHTSDIIEGVMERFVKRGNYHHVPHFLGYFHSIHDYSHESVFVFDTLFRDIVLRAERAVENMYKNETCDGAIPSQHSQHAFTVAVAAVLHLLAFVLQYLIGYIDRGGTKTYSSGCFDFRASYVSVMLFLAAFVWIKFRQAARPSTGKRKQPEHPVDDASDSSHVFRRKYGSITKYEARYLIPVNMRDEAHPVKHPRLTLGEYELPEVAAFVWRVAETCYEGQRGTCCVTLQGNPYTFPVRAMSEQERGLVGEAKRKWVMEYAKVVGKNEYKKYAERLALVTSTRSHDRSPSCRTCQPSVMLAPTPYEPLNGSNAPSCSVPPPVFEELNVGSELFQLNQQGPAKGLESRINSEGVEAQWHRESPPSGGLPTDISSTEELMRMLEEISSDPLLEQESPVGRIMPYSDSAPHEDDSLPNVESEAATVEHPRTWSVQSSQQGRVASDAVLEYADRSGTDPIFVEGSTTVLFHQQNPQVSQGSESQLAKPLQHISNRSEEPSESIPQQYERLLKDYELLRKEKECWREKYECLENSIVALARKSVIAHPHD